MRGEKGIFGVVHLPHVPYTVLRVESRLEDIVERAVEEAKAMESVEFAGVIVENFGDAPYRKKVRDPLALASIAVVVREVVRSVSIDVGVNILRNSGLEAYSVALATGARFIRINTLAETVITDSGILEPEAPRLKSVRANYPGIRVYADILVKHGRSLPYATAVVESAAVGVPLESYVKDLVLDYIERAGADALIVTGERTGEPPSLDRLRIIRKFSTVPVIVGSGASPENIKKLLEHSDGVIVGSYIRRNGRAGAPLDSERLRMFVVAARNAQ